MQCLWIFVSVILLNGCAIGQKKFDEIMLAKVKTKAAFDFTCKATEIETSIIDNATYGAQGCGKKASYLPANILCNENARDEDWVRSSCPVMPASVESMDTKR